MHFEQVHYLDNSIDFADQCGGQLDLIERGHLAAQDDRAADYFKINQTESRMAALIDGQPHPSDKIGGVCEFLVDRIFTHVHASLRPAGWPSQPKTKKADVTECPKGLPSRRLTR